MLGVGTFIRRFESMLQAEMTLMQHYAAKQRALHAWDRRYAHLQFVIKWAPRFRLHHSPASSEKNENHLAA